MLRLSVRELLSLVAFAAVAAASLKYANYWWLAAVAATVILLFFRALLIAAIDRGPSQAFAIGMTLIMAGYGSLIMSNRTTNNGNTQNYELSRGGTLPTTQLLWCLDRAISDFRWVDERGQEEPTFQPPQRVNDIDLSVEALHERLRAGDGLPGVFLQGVSLHKVPSDNEFFRIGHYWWDLLFGFAGGLFASAVYQRRQSEMQIRG